MEFKNQKIFSSFSKTFIYFSLGIGAYLILLETNSKILGFYFSLIAIQSTSTIFDFGIKSSIHSIRENEESFNTIKHLLKWFLRIYFIIFFIIILNNSTIFNLISIPDSKLLSFNDFKILIYTSIYTTFFRTFSELFSQFFYSKKKLIINSLIDTFSSVFIILVIIYEILNPNLVRTIVLLLSSTSLVPFINYLFILYLKYSNFHKNYILINLREIFFSVIDFRNNYFPKKTLSFQFFTLQLSTTIIYNLSPLIISIFANYSTTGSYRIFQLLFNALSSAMMGYYIHLWVDSNNLKNIKPIEDVISKLSKIALLPILISIIYSFAVLKLFPTQLNSSNNIIFLYGIISSISFIYGSYSSIYSLFLNGSGYPLYTCLSSFSSSVIFISITIFISKLELYQYVPIAFLLANIVGYQTIKFYSRKVHNIINNN